MNITKFKSICQNMFGRSWQSQVADYLMISRKTVSSWVDRGIVPTWVEQEIGPLVTRRVKEIKFALDSLSMNDDDFYHNLAILNGEVFYYDCDRYDFKDIQEFIENQKWSAIESAKHQIRNNLARDEVFNYVDDFILSENDIAEHLEKSDVINDIDEIKELRGDACRDVKMEIQSIFDRSKN